MLCPSYQQRLHKMCLIRWTTCKSRPTHEHTCNGEPNWSLIASNAAHTNTTFTKRQIFLLAQSGSLLDFNCRTGVHTPPQQTHSEGGRNKGNVPIVPEASGSLMCSGNEVAGKKETHSLFQLTVACHCCENKRPRRDITKPKVWVVRWNLLHAKLPRKPNIPLTGQTAAASGFSGKAAINTEPWGGSAERINDVSAVPWEVQLPSLASSGGAMKSQDWVVLCRERWPLRSH